MCARVRGNGHDDAYREEVEAEEEESGGGGRKMWMRRRCDEWVAKDEITPKIFSLFF